MIAALNPNIEFVIEDMGEEIKRSLKKKGKAKNAEYYDEEYASEYGDEVAAMDESFRVEVDLGKGVVESIKLTEDEYKKIFDEGQ
eukprot:CAMPEP_0170542610 /NCGR_PEP_ID=MMETSP0211-20121228/1980_1 /TAXON_ID=311385 /ORGANISM="Pseudokeronopsis sp., Strain OXSARD2" /LENGTH=84 /DNA_ID=CAMNT_0010845725 /DNA_START=1602 /DNA_END=1856 /DNA_ORIENTATION=-